MRLLTVLDEFKAILELLVDSANTYEAFEIAVEKRFGSLPAEFILEEVWEWTMNKHDKYIKTMERKIASDYVLKECEGCHKIKLMKPAARACSRRCTGLLGMRVSGSSNAYTGPERILMLWLLKHKILFVPQWCDGFMQPDFYVFPNICIYVDSWYHDYRNRRKVDIRIKKRLEHLGYVVIRIEDKDINEGYRPEWILDIAWKDEFWTNNVHNL